ncbi:5-hydroxytryptamine receptor 2A-like isoform X2 [Stylophora pistillata]|uniref:5-hydroxytryptamine receptor 2A-like isoform X2 n=1 Tax=Stylophora pistillata TaxID=50429 RepID=UPI000C053D83|nr:5-hydroxytryptamine receptor 2A-like isoform X2 [Stylophora pistillata]XP_022783380.1 5-hydroxytryptamine receptor 2A-like isoform X2 [Stylophora pistillata]
MAFPQRILGVPSATHLLAVATWCLTEGKIQYLKDYNTMNNTSNMSLQPPTASHQPKYNLFPELVPIAVSVIIANGVVFYLFGKMKSLRTPANYFLLSLATSDIMTGLINIPLLLVLVHLPQSSPSFSVIYCTSEVFHNVISISIAYHITAITMDKYFAVVNPFVRFVMTKKTVKKVLLSVWLCSAFLGSVPATWWDSWLALDSSALYLQAGHIIFCLCFVFFVPYSFILYAYGIMFKAVSLKRSSKESSGQKNSRVFKKANGERKCLVILLAMATTFAICWIPWFTLRLIYALSTKGWIDIKDQASLSKASQTFVIVRYLSSAVNPLLYTFFKQDFWSAFKLVTLKNNSRMPSMTPSIRLTTTQRYRGTEKYSERPEIDSIVKFEQSAV